MVVLDAQAAANIRRLQALEEKSRRGQQHGLADGGGAEVNGNETAPIFLTQLKDGNRADEGRNVHFEAKLTPIADPNLKVEWFKDGKPTIVGHRFKPIHDFGYVALDILSVIAEDSGEYVCRATNLAGHAEIRTRLECKSKSGLDLDTRHKDCVAC